MGDTSHSYAENFELDQDKDLGFFVDLAALQAYRPIGAAGEYALVGTSNATVYTWNTGTLAWTNTNLAGQVISVNAKTGAVVLIPSDIGAQAALGYTPENVSNKDITGTLGTSDNKYPSQKAVKTYSDTKIAQTANVTAIDETGIADGHITLFNKTSKVLKSALKTIVTVLGADDTTVPTSKAVKDITDTKAADNAVVHLAGTESVTGDKTLTGEVVFTKSRLTKEGGIAIQLINKTGGVSVKGTVVSVYSATAIDSAVKPIVVDVPDPIGVIYENGIADGQPVWVVISGIADALFIGNTTRGHLARGFITGDAGYVTGKVLSEPVPSSPFATDKHFYEIGHVLESRVGAGLAKVCLHFN